MRETRTRLPLFLHEISCQKVCLGLWGGKARCFGDAKCRDWPFSTVVAGRRFGRNWGKRWGNRPASC